MASIDLNTLMPFIVFWILWLVAVKELHNHFWHGFMTEYLRRSSDVDNDEPGTRPTMLTQHPISYRLLFLLFAATVIFVPVVTVFVLYKGWTG